MAKKQSAAPVTAQDKLAITQADLATIIKEIDKQVAQWNATDGELIDWGGLRVKPISTELSVSFDQLIQLSLQSPDRFGPSAYETVIAIDRFADELDRWMDAAQVRPETTNPGGSQQLWESWRNAVKAATTVINLRKPEPIKDLFERDRVSLAQIAKIYGWFTSEGSPDIQKVSEELENPGAHYDPKTWQHPSHITRARHFAEQWAKRCEERKNAIGRMAESPVDVPSTKPIAPEPLDDLIFQNVPREQIAKMKRISVEEVEARAEELGVHLGFANTLTPEQYREQEVQAAIAKRNAARDVAKATTSKTPETKFVQTPNDAKRSQKYAADPAGQTLDAMAREYQSMGMTPADIFETLKHENPTVALTLADVQQWLTPVAV